MENMSMLMFLCAMEKGKAGRRSIPGQCPGMCSAMLVKVTVKTPVIMELGGAGGGCPLVLPAQMVPKLPVGVSLATWHAFEGCWWYPNTIRPPKAVVRVQNGPGNDASHSGCDAG